MADPGEVDEVGIMHRVDIFMHAHGISGWKIDIIQSR